MPLSVGTKLGPYEILAPIGKGGMGEVYKALDTRLDREVAIKVLPAALAQDPERLARFEREAKVLASLNHPNIATIHGVEEVSGIRALVLELVPGQTLKGPLPLDEALRLAAQIAEALGAAHEKGITHRDLKPLNVMITPEGVVKVLDFGLAAVAQPSGAQEGDPSQSPTLTLSPTRAGMILGTAAYMSPEQARGQSTDRRADIWAFGVLLYEMLTGQQLFRGGTVSDILASVLKEEPNLDQVPAKVRPLLRRCLEKEPKKRLQAIGDWELLLADTPTPASPATTSRLGRLPWIAAAIAIAVAAGASWIAYRATRPAELKQLVRLDVDLGADVSLGSLYGADVAISPDGNRLVFVSKSRLFTRRLDQPKATELAGTEGAYTPFFSPDGQWVAFFAGGKLKKISVEGGAAIALCDAGNGRGGAWGEDHNIIASLAAVLSRIPDSGGLPQPLTELAQGEATHRWPQILPGGKAVLFTAHSGGFAFDTANIEVMSLADRGEGRRPKTLVRGGSYARYLGTSNGSGHLVYVNKGTLFAVPFDLDALAVRGTPAPVLEEVSYTVNSGSAQFDVSRAGTLVYRNGAPGGGLVTLQWLDGAGKLQPLPVKPGPYNSPHVSPDGKFVSLSAGSGSGSDIWNYEWQRDATYHLTFGDGNYTFPVWSPDGRYVVFHAGSGIFWTRADGAGKPQPLTQNKQGQWPWSFSPDGKRLAFAQTGAKSGGELDIWTVPLENEGGQLNAGKPEVFLQTPANELYPAFSPDGRWIAYRSSESGVAEIYVRAFPDKGGKWLISNSGGNFPVWSRNGRELFYVTPQQQIMVVTYTAKGDSFVPDKPRLWSDKRLAEATTSQNADIAPDGKRFAVLMPVETPEAQQSQHHVVFLENFFDELRRKVPAGK